MAIKDYLAKNGYIRNIIFIFAVSFFFMIIATYLLMGQTFLRVAPVLIMLTISGRTFRPPKIYLPFCVGLLLQFGLFSGLMVYLKYGLIFPVFVDFFVGTVGYLLLVTSIWQAVLGEWKLPRAIDILIQVIAILGLMLSIFAVFMIAKYGMPSATEHHETY